MGPRADRAFARREDESARARRLTSRTNSTPNLEPLAPIPGRPFALVCGLGLLISVGVGLLVASGAGGDERVLLAVGGVLAFGGALFVLPLLGPPVITPERWGLGVMLASMLRTGVALGAMLLLIEVQGLPKRSTTMGILFGTFVMMGVEAVAAVWLLTVRDRLRAVARKPDGLASPFAGGPGATGQGVGGS